VLGIEHITSGKHSTMNCIPSFEMEFVPREVEDKTECLNDSFTKLLFL
jgi:hypothetical protein